jgi:hypothetical protein
MHRFVCTIALLNLLLFGCDSSPQPPASVQPSDATPTASAGTDSTAEVRTLEWDELMPADFDPGLLFKDVDIASLSDRDPRAQELMMKLRKLWDEAPVVSALDGVRVRLPGFAIPLESDGQLASRFLLVPYYGACIHVPPPPANQTVLVEAPAGARIQRAFAPVWVTGRLTVQRADTDFARAGYTLIATDVSPYGDKLR